MLIHPSLHDSGGWVCLEAMAAGRPVICLDLGGPGLQVTEKTGIKVKASTPTTPWQIWRRLSCGWRKILSLDFAWEKLPASE